MSCTPISVSLEVDPTELRRIIFGLDKLCNNDGTSEWKLHFELLERIDPTKDFRDVVKLDVDVNNQHAALAEATAANGLDVNQRGQAAIAGATAKAVTQGQAELADAQADITAILLVRKTASPPANTVANA